MSAIAKKIVVNEQGQPLEVIIAWDVYQDLAERMGWDLSEEEAADVREVHRDVQALVRPREVALVAPELEAFARDAFHINSLSRGGRKHFIGVL